MIISKDRTKVQELVDAVKKLVRVNAAMVSRRDVLKMFAVLPFSQLENVTGPGLEYTGEETRGPDEIYRDFRITKPFDLQVREILDPLRNKGKFNAAFGADRTSEVRIKYIQERRYLEEGDYLYVGDYRIEIMPSAYEAYKAFFKSLEDRDRKLDFAMGARINKKRKILKNKAQISMPGGIDLNTNAMAWEVSKEGRGVEMTIDPAMLARIKRQGIDSLSPVIFKIAPVVSIWSLVGLPAPSRV
jgi:hypothetical protein